MRIRLTIPARTVAFVAVAVSVVFVAVAVVAAFAFVADVVAFAVVVVAVFVVAFVGYVFVVFENRIGAVTIGFTIASPTGVGERVLKIAGAVLPAAVRARFVEEWRDALYDLREQGASRRQRCAEIVNIVVHAPVLAVTLRWSRQRVVE
jgi:hypothetical protein